MEIFPIHSQSPKHHSHLHMIRSLVMPMVPRFMIIIILKMDKCSELIWIMLTKLRIRLIFFLLRVSLLFSKILNVMSLTRSISIKKRIPDSFGRIIPACNDFPHIPFSFTFQNKYYLLQITPWISDGFGLYLLGLSSSRILIKFKKLEEKWGIILFINFHIFYCSSLWILFFITTIQLSAI